MKQTLKVEIDNIKNINYEINIADEDFDLLRQNIDKVTVGKKRLFVVSSKVYRLYAEVLGLKKEEVFILKDGEREKNYKNYLKILEKAFQMGLTRDDILIALGGGVVGDITGFVAATYMRGINYIQVPTTLLAMVDSSVGGKTAIDFADGKNIVGAFYQPKAVFININFLKTLDDEQYKSGLGEILKYAFIEDNCGYKHSLFFFEYLTLCCEKLLSKEAMTLMRVIEYSLNLKLSIVQQDEKESGLRKVLNLGHTLGHALEAFTKYKKYSHGEAVIYGIYFILAWAYKKNMITYSYYRLSVDLLSKYGFKGFDFDKIDIAKLIEFMKKDKKAHSDSVSFIVPCGKKKVQEVILDYTEIEQMF